MTAATFGLGGATAAPAQCIGEDVRLRRRGILLMTAALCLTFQFFFSIGAIFETHPLAPFLLMEATLGGLLVWSTLALLLKAREGTATTLDVFFYLTPVCFMLTSATLAMISLGQPIHLGLGEDRRVLSFLFWFLLEPIQRRHRLTFEDIVRALVMAACVYVVCGLVLQTALADALRARNVPDEDPRKLRISTPSDCFMLCWLIGLTRICQGERRLSWSALAVGLVGLLAVAQTRQFIIAALIVSALVAVWHRPVRSLTAGVLAGAGALLLTAATGSNAVEQTIGTLLPKIDEFSGQNLGENTRTRTALIVTDALLRNNFVGLGAVSLLFEDGLQRYYGRNFYINDVGLLGEAYRVGFLVLAFLAALATVYVSLWRRLSARHRAVVLPLLLALALLAPSSGLLWRIGFCHAFLAVLMVAGVAQRQGADHTRADHTRAGHTRAALTRSARSS